MDPFCSTTLVLNLISNGDADSRPRSCAGNKFVLFLGVLKIRVTTPDPAEHKQFPNREGQRSKGSLVKVVMPFLLHLSAWGHSGWRFLVFLCFLLVLQSEDITF